MDQKKLDAIALMLNVGQAPRLEIIRELLNAYIDLRSAAPTPPDEASRAALAERIARRFFVGAGRAGKAGEMLLRQVIIEELGEEVGIIPADFEGGIKISQMVKTDLGIPDDEPPHKYARFISDGDWFNEGEDDPSEINPFIGKPGE